MPPATHPIYAAIGHGDYSEADWADPRIEYVIADGPDPGSFTGRDGLVQAMRSLFGAIEDVRAEAEEYRELDAERVLVLVQASAPGKASGLEVGQMRTTHATLFHIRDSKVTRARLYWEPRTARSPTWASLLRTDDSAFDQCPTGPLAETGGDR